MKIYNKVVIDIETGEIIKEDSFDYHGPVAECKGGGSTINSQDPAYNARMAAIAEAQQAMAEEYFDFWKSEYKPYESAMIKANQGLIPAETQLRQAQLQGQLQLTPLQVQAQEAQLAGAPGAISQFYQSAGSVDEKDWMGQAGADVAQQFDIARGSLNRNLARMGVMSGSGRMIGMQKDLALAEAKALAGAKSQARRAADEEKFKRLGAAASFGLGAGF